MLRWTLWESFETNDPIQLSVCVLAADWEPLMERTLPCGPFHSAEERRLELLDDVRRWLRCTGYQEELAL